MCSCLPGYMLDADGRRCAGKFEVHQNAWQYHIPYAKQTLMSVLPIMETVVRYATTPLEVTHALV